MKICILPFLVICWLLWIFICIYYDRIALTVPCTILSSSKKLTFNNYCCHLCIVVDLILHFGCHKLKCDIKKTSWQHPICVLVLEPHSHSFQCRTSSTDAVFFSFNCASLRIAVIYTSHRVGKYIQMCWKHFHFMASVLGFINAHVLFLAEIRSL